MSELSPFSRDLLARSRAERTPSDAARQRVFGAVVATGALGGATAAAAPSLLGKLGGVAAKWWLVGGVCLALVGGGARLVLHGETAPRRLPTIAHHSFTPLAVQPRVAPPSVGASDELAHDALAPSTTSLPEPTHQRSVTAPKLDGTGTQLEQEVSLLHEAHDAYNRGRPAQALGLIAQHRARFPKSQLTSERATLEVLTLCRLGRVADAQQLAGKLRARSGTTATLSGLEGSCAASK